LNTTTDQSLDANDIEHDSQPDHLRQAALIVAATALSLAVYQNSGNISSAAILFVSLSLMAMIVAIFGQHLFSGMITKSGLFKVAGVCLCAQFAALVWSTDLPLGHSTAPAVRILMIILGVAAVIAGGLLSIRPWLGKWSIPALAILALGVGLFVIHGLPMPGIDVLMFQMISSDALLQGVNPYTIRFPDPYPPESSAMFYGPGVSVDGILQFGFPYMPLSLFMVLPGYLLGDVRYTHLLAMVGTGLLIWRSGTNRPISSIAAALLLFSPIFPLMVFLAWTESQIALLLALTVYCHQRRPALMPFALGLLLASKQYMPAMAPLALLLLPRPWTFKSILDLT